MASVVALLRAVNVGNRKVPMEALRDVCVRMGLSAPRTYVASGNVAFETELPHAAVAEGLSAALAERFGFEVPVVVRTADQLRTALAANPFTAPPAGEKLLHVAFLDRAPDPAAVAALDPDRSPGDQFAVSGAEIFLRYGASSARSRLTVDWFERRLGRVGTARNVRTVRALIDLVERG